MITINLLAPGRRRPAGPSSGKVLAIAGTALIIGTLVVISLFLGGRVTSLHRQLDDVTKKVVALRPVALEVEQLEVTLKRLQDRQAVLQTLLANQLPATDSLKAIRAVIPRDVWLISLTTSGTKGVLFDGYTFSYKSVARFMVALRDSERFRNIDLTSTQREKIGERDVVKFQVTGEVTPTHASRPGDPSGGSVTSPGGNPSEQPAAPPAASPAPRMAAQKAGDPE